MLRISIFIVYETKNCKNCAYHISALDSLIQAFLLCKKSSNRNESVAWVNGCFKGCSIFVFILLLFFDLQDMYGFFFHFFFNILAKPILICYRYVDVEEGRLDLANSETESEEEEDLDSVSLVARSTRDRLSGTGSTQSGNQFINLFIHPFNHQSVHPFIRSTIYYPTIHAYIYQFICSSIHLFISSSLD